MTTMHGMTAATDENLARRIAVDGDLRFKLAMLDARARKLERFSIGVDARPCTEIPLVVTPLAALMSNNASPAAQCSEFGTNGGWAPRTFGQRQQPCAPRALSAAEIKD